MSKPGSRICAKSGLEPPWHPWARSPGPDEILAHSRKRFGLEAADRYEALVLRAFLILRDDPAGVLVRTTSPGIFSFHLRHVPQSAPKPVRRPRHLLVFRHRGDRVAVVRILHESMDLDAHLR
jgi:plasmid stabilization system protein ParE